MLFRSLYRGSYIVSNKVGIAVTSAAKTAVIKKANTCLRVGLSPKENIIKEVQEETGFNVSVSRLLAIFDTNKFQFQSKQYAKLVFECQIEDENFQPNTEIEELAFFDIQSLPELSSKRTTKEQLEILWEIYQGDREQYLD